MLSSEQLQRERTLCKITLYEKESIIKPEYKQLLLKRINFIDKELDRRNLESKNELEFKFIGLPSYDLRVFYIMTSKKKFNFRKTQYLKTYMQLTSITFNIINLFF